VEEKRKRRGMNKKVLASRKLKSALDTQKVKKRELPVRKEGDGERSSFHRYGGVPTDEKERRERN